MNIKKSAKEDDVSKGKRDAQTLLLLSIEAAEWEEGKKSELQLSIIVEEQKTTEDFLLLD